MKKNKQRLHSSSEIYFQQNAAVFQSFKQNVILNPVSKFSLSSHSPGVWTWKPIL